MTTIRVIKTYKDGVLTSSKKVEVAPAIDPKTKKPQTAPRHSRVLNEADSARLSIIATLEANERLAHEARQLRKQLLRAENQIKARIQERNGLRKAHKSKLQQVEGLQLRIEDLQAEVHSARDDYNFLEEENKKLKQCLVAARRSVPVSITAARANATNTAPLKEQPAGIKLGSSQTSGVNTPRNTPSNRPSPLTSELIADKKITAPPQNAQPKRPLRAIAAKPRLRK